MYSFRKCLNSTSGCSFFHRSWLSMIVVAGVINAASLTHAELVTGWNVGEQAPDFEAFYLNGFSGAETPTSWHAESGADVYVVSTCAVWCSPCQLFAQQSEAMRQTLASEGIDAEFYDLVFQDFNGLEPDATIAQLWIDNVWTSDPENVWYGGMISESVPGNVTHDIFTAQQNAGGSGFAIPAIVVMDHNFVVQDLIEGFDPSQTLGAARLAAVPEPGSAMMMAPLGLLFLRRRRWPLCR